MCSERDVPATHGPDRPPLFCCAETCLEFVLAESGILGLWVYEIYIERGLIETTLMRVEIYAFQWSSRLRDLHQDGPGRDDPDEDRDPRQHTYEFAS